MFPRIQLLILLLILASISACNTTITPLQSTANDTSTPSEEKANQIFVPILSQATTSTSSNWQSPLVTPTPFIHLGEPSGNANTLTIVPTPENLRGQRFPIANHWVQLPKDAYWVMDPPASVLNRLPYEQLPFPIAILQQDTYMLAVSLLNGKMFFLASTQQGLIDSINSYDFIVNVLGRDNILPPDAACKSCILPQSPLPTPASTP